MSKPTEVERLRADLRHTQEELADALHFYRWVRSIVLCPAYTPEGKCQMLTSGIINREKGNGE